MKTATYRLLDGTDRKIEYDENAPCMVCGEPVIEASMGGTSLCPWCDCGNCRYCGVRLPIGRDKEHSIELIKEHIDWHKQSWEAAKEQSSPTQE
jgi:hypothetical protein